jgi:nucleoside phosphorylase/sugar phosphate isomerase/epimerase
MPDKLGQDRGSSHRCALILHALGPELKALEKHFKPVGDGRANDKVRNLYFKGTFEADNGVIWTVYLGESGPGNVNAATMASAAIPSFKPDIAIMTGIAGALEPEEFGIGDVVAASEICYCEYGSVNESFEHRPKDYHSTTELVSACRDVARNSNWQKRRKPPKKNFAGPPKATVGVIVAGEKVVKSTKSPHYRFLKKRFQKAPAVEMEGAGFMAAASQFPNVPSIVIRGLSDELDDKSKTDKAGCQLVAAANVAAFVVELLNILPKNDDDDTILGKGPEAGAKFEVRGGVPKDKEPELCRLMAELSRISTTISITLEPERVPKRKICAGVYGSVGAGKSHIISQLLREDARSNEERIAERQADSKATYEDLLHSRKSAPHLEFGGAMTASFALPDAQLYTLNIKQFSDTARRDLKQSVWINEENVRLEIRHLLGLLDSCSVGIGNSKVPAQSRIAPSIVTRSEAQLFGCDDLRFAIRTYLDDKGSFVNVRRMAEFQKRAISGILLDFSELASSHAFLFDYCGNGAREIEPVADGALVPSDRLRSSYSILEAKLGEIYGEGSPITGTPYVRHLSTSGGAACAQACIFMASLLLHDRVLTKGGAQLHSLMEIDAIAKGGATQLPGEKRFANAYLLNGMKLTDMVVYLTATGKKATIESVPLGEDLKKSAAEFSVRIRSFLRAGLPVIAIVRSGSLDARDRSSPTPSRISGKVDHVVLVVGASYTDDGFLVNDPSGKPFTEISATRLFEMSLSHTGGNTRVARCVAVAPDHSFQVDVPFSVRRWWATESLGSTCQRGLVELEPSLLTSFRHGDAIETLRDWWPDPSLACSLIFDDASDLALGRAGLRARGGGVDESRFDGRFNIPTDLIGRRIASVYCFTHGLTQEEAAKADKDIERVCRAISLVRSTSVNLFGRKGTGQVPPILIAVGNRISGIQRLKDAGNGGYTSVTALPTPRVLDLLVARLEEIARRSGLVPSDGISLAIELEPGPFYAVNSLASLSYLAARVSENPLLSNVVGFNLDTAHFALAGITPSDVVASTSVCSRIAHASFSDHGPGHFGDVALGEVGLGSSAGLTDKLAPFKDWIRFLNQRILMVPEGQRPVAFSRHVSVELEAAKTVKDVMATVETLRRLLLGEHNNAIRRPEGNPG